MVLIVWSQKTQRKSLIRLCTQRTRSIDSSMRGGLSHHSRQTAFSDEDTIHWGDLDPQLAARLQSDPAALRTWKLMRKPAKQARLDSSTAQFAMPTDVPEQQVATGSQDPPNITTNNLKTAIEEYHNQFVNPALQELHSQLQYQLQSQHKTLAAAQAITGFSEQSVATEMHKCSVIVHGLPLFVSKKAIDDNLWYLLGLALCWGSHLSNLKEAPFLDLALPKLDPTLQANCLRRKKILLLVKKIQPATRTRNGGQTSAK